MVNTPLFLVLDVQGVDTDLDVDVVCVLVATVDSEDKVSIIMKKTPISSGKLSHFIVYISYIEDIT